MIGRREFVKSAAAIGMSAMGLGAVWHGTLVAKNQFQSTGLNGQPNVVLIMLDDTGYECFETLGRSELQTPNINRLASEGVTFNQCESTPICTPSRVKLMTGRHNFKNYDRFAYLNPKEKTFGNLLRDAGYATGVFGKWQLSSAKESRENLINGTPEGFGFDEFCLHAYTPKNTEMKNVKGGARFYKPALVDNQGGVLGIKDRFGPDVVNDRVLGFIDKHQAEPFFVYYPMMLAHWPFVTTPLTVGDGVESDKLKPQEANIQKNFKDMVFYADMLIGNVIDRLKTHGIYDNTLILITSDNGTYPMLGYEWDGAKMYGGKSYPQFSGNRVPMVARLGTQAGSGAIFSDLIDFTDVLPTIADAVGLKVPREYDVDGRSFLPRIVGEKGRAKEFLLSYYPSISIRAERRCIYVRNHEYKLYWDGRLYAVDDREELNPIFTHQDTQKSAVARQTLEQALADSYAKYPKLVEMRESINQEFDRKRLGLVIGSWIANGQAECSWDVSAFIKSSGTQTFRIQQYKGVGDVRIRQVVLFCNGVEVARDDHIAESAQIGGGYIFKQKHTKTLFELDLQQYDMDGNYTLRAEIEPAKEGPSIGHIRFVSATDEITTP
ncbi:sulfatase-like hydrolase/transferase [Poriferisphaera sp. WC338]|uniref:sulfatase-like hydrolase/transferase n=1 Tax=Poriferisphaera sp. WC338 TaxID=3425129 RepID=UPI003D814004